MSPPTIDPAVQRPQPISIAVLDVQPTRQGLLKELQKVRGSYFRLRTELERHKGVTRPAYFAWYEEQFGAKAAYVARLRLAFEEKSQLADRMNALYTWRGMTRQKAYAQAKADRDAMKAKREREEELARKYASEAASKNEYRAKESVDESLRDPLSEAPAEGGLEIKAYYRKLARALHPDRVGMDCPVLRGFWLETQEAYQARDLVRLKLIWTECLVDADPETGEFQSVDLKLAISRLRGRFHQIQREKIAISKSDPSWRFEKRDRDALAESILSSLSAEQAELEESVAALDREMRAFARPNSAPASD